jgi:HD-GYP domain-containing protein (c-di-GMP phosphodiesterase class II)
MKLPSVKVKQITTAALLHDIGKIILPLNLLNKPGKLTTDEYDEIKKHPEIGFRILNSSHNMRVISEFVFAHHERIDGNGYPRGITGEEIPIESKIIGIADAFDAMTSDRTYKKRLTLEAAIKELKDNAGSQFDQEVVSVFIENIEAILA